MTGAAWAQLCALIILLAVTTPLLGSYMAKVFGEKHAPGERVFLPIERTIYRLSGVDPESEQRWTTYALSLLAFSFVSVVVLYIILRVQGHLPDNPDHIPGMSPTLSFNTAISFLTNTNWQNYGGETAAGQVAQMAGLVIQMFLSAAAGLCVAIALIRGLTRRKARTLGNFWVDLVRGTVRILLPISVVFAVVFVFQGVEQNLHAAHTVTTLTGQHQTIVGGPLASQESIENLGNNGGGYTNANGANPLQNPNPLSNLLIIWLLLLIPFSLPWTFGKMAKDRKQGVAVLAAMFVLWLGVALVAMPFEARGNIHVSSAGVSQQATPTSPGGNLEGKELRFGAPASALFGASATSTSTGAVDAAHDSFTPIGGGAMLVNMMLGEVSPGGTGAGLYGMLLFAIMAVFIAGLMVGRTPEYLGKKIQAAEMKLVVLYILLVPLVALGFAAMSVLMTTALNGRTNLGPHGLTEIVYAFVSTSNNNGSAFAGLSGNTDWYNMTFGICMLVGRFALMVPVLAIAGSLGRKQITPVTSGTLPTGTPLFATLLVGVVVIVVGLTYFPVLALGPIAEHLVGKF
jgi:K+-transporting ATPase ATPase A chain